MLLRMVHPAIPARTHEKLALAAWLSGLREHLKNVSLAIKDSHDPCLARTKVELEALGSCQRIQPLHALLLLDRALPLLLSLRLAEVIAVADPNLLPSDPQRNPLGCCYQDGLKQEAVMSKVSQWPKAFRLQVLRVVELGCVPDRQNHFLVPRTL